MSTASQFFRNNIAATRPLNMTPKSTYIDVGGDFTAVAIAIIDKVLSRPKSHQFLFKDIMDHYTRFFPLPVSISRLVPPYNGLQHLANQGEAFRRFIGEVAYVLRQIAVDELFLHPYNYSSAFILHDIDWSPSRMRQPDYPMTLYMIAALANALDTPMTIQVLETGKELPLKRYIGPNKEQLDLDKLVLQSYNGYFIPKVLNVSRFKAVAESIISSPLNPLTSTIDPNLNRIIALIEEKNKPVIDAFERHQHRLITMVRAGEINKTTLLSMYVNGLKTQDGFLGSPLLFKEGLHQVGHKNHVVAHAKERHDNGISLELVKAIAHALSNGQLDETKVFGHIEQDNPSLKFNH